MVKLDNGRKFILIVIVIGVICLMFMGQQQSSQTAAAQATPPPAAPAATAPVAPTTAPSAAVPGSAPSTASAVPAATVPDAPAVTPSDAPTATIPDAPVVAPSDAPAPTPEATQPLSPETKSFEKLIVYHGNINDNHYVLSGFMPTGKCIKINDFWKDNCKEGQRCLQINYDVACSIQDQGWAGTYWLQPANNWGDQKGGYNLTGAQKLVFWARGEQGGEVIDSFKIGGVTGADHKFPDSDTASIGPVTLTKEWQQYTIDLKGKDLSYIVGGFAWAANAQSNPQAITFYLDNIYYE